MQTQEYLLPFQVFKAQLRIFIAFQAFDSFIHSTSHCCKLGSEGETIINDGYLIERNKKEKELLDFIRHEVDLSGTMREDEGGNLIFKVERIQFNEGVGSTGKFRDI